MSLKGALLLKATHAAAAKFRVFAAVAAQPATLHSCKRALPKHTYKALRSD